jgi:hypothetical protein
MVETETWYPITWLGIRGDRYVLDVANKMDAQAIAVGLAEVGRKFVQLHNPYVIDVDLEVREKIRARLVALRAGLPIEQLIRAAAS